MVKMSSVRSTVRVLAMSIKVVDFISRPTGLHHPTRDGPGWSYDRSRGRVFVSTNLNVLARK